MPYQTLTIHFARWEFSAFCLALSSTERLSSTKCQTIRRIDVGETEIDQAMSIVQGFKERGFVSLSELLPNLRHVHIEACRPCYDVSGLDSKGSHGELSRRWSVAFEEWLRKDLKSQVDFKFEWFKE
jgi:hypothetical protein